MENIKLEIDLPQDQETVQNLGKAILNAIDALASTEYYDKDERDSIFFQGHIMRAVQKLILHNQITTPKTNKS